jgi:hypothetical protein
MATTIQLNETTKQSLEKYKQDVEAETYEETIADLLRRVGHDSAFGSMSGWGEWDEDDRSQARSDTGRV